MVEVKGDLITIDGTHTCRQPVAELDLGVRGVWVGVGGRPGAGRGGVRVAAWGSAVVGQCGDAHMSER